MTLKRSVFLLLSFLFLVSAVHAQRLTGTIKGTVSDDTNTPIPGVTVTLTSDALIGGAQVATTDATGDYRFPALPPGLYKVSFSLEGFQTTVYDEVRVVLGTTIEQNVQLGLSKVAEQMVITGETPLIDSTKPGFSTNFTQEALENTPIARFTFFDFVQMAPGSSPMRFDNTAFAHSILGSNTNENMYQMDGTDLTSSLTGAAWPWPNTDIIEEIEILDIGAPAEYGNYQGAVVNVVTKSGGNEYHGDGNFYWQTQGLTDQNVEIDGIPFHRDKYTDFTFQMGGPILKDKLWFFGGVQTRREHFSQPGTPPEFPVKENDDRYFFKFTYDVTQRNKLTFSLHNDYYEIPEQVSITKPFESALTETGSNPTPNVMWTSVINDKTILEVRYAGFYGHDVGEPQSGVFESGHYDGLTGYYSGGIISFYDGDIWKSQVSAKMSYFADDFLKGDHDFRFGVQYTNAGNDYIAGLTNGVYFYDYDNAPYVAYYQAPYHYGADVSSIGVFIDDTWSVNDNLTLSLGVRFDRSTASIPDFPQLNTAGGETGTNIRGLGDVAQWNVVSPRFGFTYKLNTKKATQFRGHYGRYYQALLTNYVHFASPSRSTITGKFFNPDTGQFDDIFSVLDPSTQIKIDPDLKDPYTDQFAIGFDREITPTIAVGANYIYKRSRDFVGTINTGGTYRLIPFVNPLTGETIQVFDQTNDPTTDNLFFITNPDFFREEYHGFLVSVTKRMNEDWSMSGSFTVSKAEGLHAGSGLGPAEDQDSSFFPLDNATFGQDPNDYLFADGLLNGDRTYIFKLQGSYQFPWDVLFSLNTQYLTGRPFAAHVHVPDLAQGPRDIFAEKRDGNRRTSNVSITDIRIEKNFPLSGPFSVAVSADIFNLFNTDAFTDVATTLVSPETQSIFGQGSVFVPPRRLMLGAKIRF